MVASNFTQQSFGVTDFDQQNTMSVALLAALLSTAAEVNQRKQNIHLSVLNYYTV